MALDSIDGKPNNLTAKKRLRYDEIRAEMAGIRANVTGQFIYALVDPSTKTIKYVGQCRDPIARFSQHLRCAGPSSTKTGRWLSTLIDAGILPEMKLLLHLKALQYDDTFTLGFAAEVVERMIIARAIKGYLVCKYIEVDSELTNSINLK